MNKVTVTKLQMDAIKKWRDGFGESLEILIAYARVNNLRGTSEPINLMSIEQIVLAWHGYADVEPDFVDFDEAMKALSKRETIYYHYTATTIFGEALEKTLKINFGMKPSYFNPAITLEDLVKGKFTIEGDNK